MMDTTTTALRDNYKRPEVYNYLDGDKESEGGVPLWLSARWSATKRA
jgi:hypothetical protein